MSSKTLFCVLSSSLALGLLSYKGFHRRPASMLNDVSHVCSSGSCEILEEKTRSPSPSEASGHSSTAVVHAASFLNQYVAAHGSDSWEVDYDDLLQFESTVAKGKPCFRLLHLRDPYPPPGSNLYPVHFMRLLGFFPATTTTDVYTHLTDLKLRRLWDKNYQMFEQFPADQAPPKEDLPIGVAANHLGKGLPGIIGDEMRRPIHFLSNKTTPCYDGGISKLVSYVESRAVDRGWFCHTVGSPSLSRLGLAPRLFLYERTSNQYYFADSGMVPNDASDPKYEAFCKQSPLLVYDILYTGTSRDTELATRSCSALQEWIKAIKKGIFNKVDVELNYQHILLLPIIDYEQQILSDPHFLVKQLSESGSINDEKATQTMYEIFKESSQILADAQTVNSFTSEWKKLGGKSGVLLLITSANNVGIPQSLPQFVQTAFVTAVTKQAYQNLMKACRANSS
ncbi:unnamed protein product [Phytomonas sp. Hart1]|nr:unnamed protein product [Phytomonas sp. Hart1]|eukprot:CCW69442.1 unnamed protein product [Phytomonas sp. isolate Hart1]